MRRPSGRVASGAEHTANNYDKWKAAEGRLERIFGMGPDVTVRMVKQRLERDSAHADGAGEGAANPHARVGAGGRAGGGPVRRAGLALLLADLAELLADLADLLAHPLAHLALLLTDLARLALTLARLGNARRRLVRR